MKEVDPWGIIEKLRLQHKAEIHEQWMPLVAEYRKQVDALQSRLESLEKDCEELIKDRDEREDVINELLNQVLQDDRREWSSAYDFNDAVVDVECKMKSLEKDAARYRFAKSDKSQGESDILIMYKVWGGDQIYLSGDKADNAIDTAMQANKWE